MPSGVHWTLVRAILNLKCFQLNKGLILMLACLAIKFLGFFLAKAVF